MTPTPKLWQGLSALALASACLTATLPAQAPRTDSPNGETTKPESSRSGLLRLRAGTFDPVTGSPEIPSILKAGKDIGLFIVQFGTLPTESHREEIRRTGADIHGYLPDDAYVVRGNETMASKIAAVSGVRFVGAYEPAYRLDPQFVNEWLQTQPIGDRRYNFVVVDKRADKPALARAIRGLGGEVVDMHEGSLLFTADLSQQELFAAARLDEVLWIDLWSAPEEDMDNARVQGGGNYIESAGSYRGQGVRGHIYEGAQASHPDFTPALTNVASSGAAQSHGHCTAGIVFGNGSSAAAARGMAPEARGFYTDYSSASGSRNSIVNQLVNTHQVMFTTASWGNSRTTAYTSVSADADDIIFDHRIPWTQSQSNSGNQQSRPQAWAKNIFSIGGVRHQNNSSASDDSWAAGGASTGPAVDGRIKPDLCAYYDQILTSDRTGSSGYTSGSTYSNFGGTSGATPIVAGHNALAIQMYTDGLFGSNTIRVPNGTVFENRPLAQTLKALMIVGANQYSFTSSSSDNRREHQGWGFPSLRKLYDEKDDIFIVPEDSFLQQGATDSYTVTVGASEPQLKICMTYVEPAGNPAASQTRINDLSLRVTAPNGTVYLGNAGLRTGNYSTSGGSFDTVDPVECVMLQNPAAGDWTVEVIATSIVVDSELSTPGTDASYALAVLGGTSNGGTPPTPTGCARYLPDDTPDTGSTSPESFGEYQGDTLLTAATGNANVLDGGAVYMDLQLTDRVTINALRVNTNGPFSPNGIVEVFMLPKGSSVFGNEDQREKFALRSSGTCQVIVPNFLVVCQLEDPIVLEPGLYGMAIKSTNFGHQFQFNAGAQTVSSGSMQVLTGSASNVAFQAPIITGSTPSIEFQFADHAIDNDTNSNIRYQTIIRQAELGDPGFITGLALAANWTGIHSSETLEVYMGNVPAGWPLTTNMLFNSLNAQLVLSRTAHDWWVREDEWNAIGLQVPFSYNGTGDVVVEIRVTGNAPSDPGAGFRSASNRPRIVANNWSGALPTLGNISDDDGLKMQVQFGCADGQVFGNGCGGMQLNIESRPIVDQTFQVSVQTERLLTPTVLHLGVESGNGYPARLDFFGFGWPDCVLWHDVLATVPGFTGFDGRAPFNLIAPNLPGISLAPLYVQGLQLNPNFPNGATTSNYGRLVLGEDM